MSPFGFLSGVAWSVLVLTTLASSSPPSAKEDPTRAPDALQAFPFHNRHQCQRLCWYTGTCVRYSYNNRTAVRADGSNHNCVLHATVGQGEELEDGWGQSPASDDDMAADHGCLTRPCGQTELCIPKGRLRIDHDCHILPDMNDCALSPCQSGGTCQDQVKAYTCNCAAGYSGDHCEIDIDECGSLPCQNGGTCQDQVNAYTCNCAAGYSGDHCEIDVDECASSPCQNGGTCDDEGNAYTCNCKAGYSGDRCEINMDECSSSPCQNGGTCDDNVNAYTCNCPAGYIGDRCERNVDECGSLPCQNGGTCRDQVNAYTCNCAAGYSGDHCEIDIDECASSPCQYGGTCEDKVNAYTCNCKAGFSGDRCELWTCPIDGAHVTLIGTCFKLHTAVRRDWTSARDACVADGGTLVMMDTPEKEAALMGFFRAGYTSTSTLFYIGAHRPYNVWDIGPWTGTNGGQDYVWLNEQPVIRNPEFWTATEPNKYYNENALIIYKPGYSWFWDIGNYGVTSLNHYICEYVTATTL